ncbi:MAG: zf-HC2 domain-containing protein [Acidobacteria bacterium]|nr:zf-HC2 domain-containing protein [Acidobacteriota bacterium]
MTCQQMETFAIPYLDGKLPAPQQEAVKTHLASCVSCAERMQDFSAVSSLLEEWQDIQPSSWFHVRLKQRLAQEEGGSRWLARWLQPFRLIPLRIPAVALALLVLISLVVLRIGYSPGLEEEFATEPAAPSVAAITASVDEVALYQSLPVLENWELLRNFEVLQEIGSANP